MVLNHIQFRQIVSPIYDWDGEMYRGMKDISLADMQEDQMLRGRKIYEIVQTGNLKYAIKNHWDGEFYQLDIEDIYEASQIGKEICAEDEINSELIIRIALLGKHGVVEL